MKYWWIGLVVMSGWVGAEPSATLTAGMTLSVAWDKGGWLVPVSFDGPDDRGWLLLDTGASRTRLAREFVPTVFSTLYMGSLKFPAGPLATITADQVVPLGRRRMFGMLGGDILSRMPFKLDPLRRELVFFSALPLSLGAEVSWNPLQISRSTPVAEASVGSVRGSFLLDTGAGGVVLSPSFAERMGLDRVKLKPYALKTVGSVNGPMRIQTTVVDSLEMGPITLIHPVVDVEPGDVFADGTMGQEVLKEAVSWWDYRGGRIGFEGFGGARRVSVSAFGYDRLAVRQMGSEGRHDEVIRAARALQATYPEEMDLVIWEAGALSAAGHHDQALAAMEAALKRRPEDPDLHHNLPAAYYSNGKFQRAVDVAERALVFFPEDFYLLDVLVDGNRMLKNRELALAWARRLSRAHAWRREAPWSVGRTAVEAGKFEEAIPPLKVAAPQYGVEGALWLAEAYVGASKKDEAFTTLEKFYAELSQFASHPRAKEFLVRFRDALKKDPAFEPLRSDPRYEKLVRPAPKS